MLPLNNVLAFCAGVFLLFQIDNHVDSFDLTFSTIHFYLLVCTFYMSEMQAFLSTLKI